MITFIMSGNSGHSEKGKLKPSIDIPMIRNTMWFGKKRIHVGPVKMKPIPMSSFPRMIQLSGLRYF